MTTAERICAVCSVAFMAKVHNQRFCSHACGKKYYGPKKRKIRNVYAAGVHRENEWFRDEFGNPTRQVGDVG